MSKTSIQLKNEKNSIDDKKAAIWLYSDIDDLIDMDYWTEKVEDNE